MLVVTLIRSYLHTLTLLLTSYYASIISQPKADVTQIANALGMVHSGCGLLTGSDFSVRSMCIFLEGSGEESHKTHHRVH